MLRRICSYNKLLINSIYKCSCSNVIKNIENPKPNSISSNVSNTSKIPPLTTVPRKPLYTIYQDCISTISDYLFLSKIKLSFAVAATASTACYIYQPLDFSILGMVCGGTLLLSAAANSINQLLEISFDSQMGRTKIRPLVTGKITPLNSVVYSCACFICGFGLLYYCAPISAYLGLLNLFLYTSVYTPMKRFSLHNTNVGGVVGAIPPLMGICASMNYDTSMYLLPTFLFLWQLNHFHSLSWKRRDEYTKAGYNMACVTNVSHCKTSCLLSSLGMGPIFCLAYYNSLINIYCFVPSILLIFISNLYSFLFWKSSDIYYSAKIYNFSLYFIFFAMVSFVGTKAEWLEKIFNKLCNFINVIYIIN